MAESGKLDPFGVGPRSGQLFGNRGRLVMVAAVLALALGFLVFTAFPGSVRYYLTVEELVAQQQEMDGKRIRVVGSLVPDSFLRTSGTTHAEFVLTDGDQNLTATYLGVLPDLFFNPHSEIVLEGTFGDGGVFNGDMVIVKCPSKYEALGTET